MLVSGGEEGEDGGEGLPRNSRLEPLDPAFVLTSAKPPDGRLGQRQSNNVRARNCSSLSITPSTSIETDHDLSIALAALNINHLKPIDHGWRRRRARPLVRRTLGNHDDDDDYELGPAGSTAPVFFIYDDGRSRRRRRHRACSELH